MAGLETEDTHKAKRDCGRPVPAMTRSKFVSLIDSIRLVLLRGFGNINLNFCKSGEVEISIRMRIR